MIAVQCHLHGLRILTKSQYRAQSRDDATCWRCPVCGRDGNGQDIAPELVDLGCQECKEPLAFEGAAIYDEDLAALFCGRWCQTVYRERLQANLTKGRRT